MSGSIQQAVILAGGRGTRLMPLTENCPKPMVLVDNVPFLQHLLNQLSLWGFKRVVILIGYKGEQVSHYFGSQYNGMSLTYSHQDDSLDTAQRVWAAQTYYDERFLLMYSDNYLRLDFYAHLSNWKAQDALQLLVQSKKPGNLVVENNKAKVYDNRRNNPKADYVELGFMLVNWSMVASFFDAKTLNFNHIIERAIAHNCVGATIENRPYISISDPARLEKVKHYFSSNQPVLLLDRDGTINQRAEPGEYIYKQEDFHFVPGVIEALSSLAKSGFSFVIITNQAGIARGKYSVEDVEKLHGYMKQKLAEHEITIADIYMCPHHWDEDCLCRKPAPGMFYHYEKAHAQDVSKMIYVGDDPRDMQAAANAGTASIFIGEYESGVMGDQLPTLGRFDSLNDAVPTIKNWYFKSDS